MGVHAGLYVRPLRETWGTRVPYQMPESFDEAFPGGFEECVSTLGQEPSIDDPEKLCGWLQEHGFEALRETGADTVLAGLEVEFVSVVDEPAQDSEWLLAKSANADEANWTPGENRIRTADVLLKADGDEEEDDEADRKVWAAVLKPGEADAHGDLVPEPEIESAAHRYLKEYRKMDADHDLLDGEGVPIESYIVRGSPDEFTTPGGKAREYPPGTWIMGAELSEEAWKRVEDGELTGFSIYGGAAKLNAAALLSEEQEKALQMQLGKAVDLDDLGDAISAFEEDTGTDPDEATLREFVEWVGENPDYDEEEQDDEEEADGDDADENDEEETEEASKNVSSEVEAQVNELHATVTKNMGDDDGDGDGAQNEISETLTEIRDTVKNTNETVQKHDDRLDSLRDDLDDLGDDVEETRKAVGLVEDDGEETEESEAGSEATPDDGGDDGGADADSEAAKAVRDLRDELEKSGVLGDDDGDESEDVDRKAQKNAGADGDESESVEKSEGEINVSFEGIAEADD